nr:MAG TPA_asm: hypothetical protein [Caudoviricetes sp.]
MRHSTPRGARVAWRPRNRGSNLNFTPQGRAQ